MYGRVANEYEDLVQININLWDKRMMRWKKQNDATFSGPKISFAYILKSNTEVPKSKFYQYAPSKPTNDQNKASTHQKNHLRHHL